jgi:uncharacterized protein YbbC (DUF1343 family)
MFEPFQLGIKIIDVIRTTYPEDFEFLDTHFIDKLIGTDEFRLLIKNNSSLPKLIESWDIQSENFIEFRKPYLLYPLGEN